ncbi:hypothetical protein [Sphingomonas sp. NFX23]|uniref:hypothetical protein n=1 Tax=Sphingomonas sp. NFX23 TaxID=2819532 RepID=UPI003CE82CE5
MPELAFTELKHEFADHLTSRVESDDCSGIFAPGLVGKRLHPAIFRPIVGLNARPARQRPGTSVTPFWKVVERTKSTMSEGSDFETAIRPPAKRALRNSDALLA